MLKAIILFVIGLALLIVCGDFFVDGATDIARKYHVPELLIGATIVSIGTTLPEVLVSAQAAIKGHGEIAYGNAIGSVICNTALISALTIAIKPGTADKKALIKPVCFFFGSAIFYAIIAYATGYFSRIVGLILLAVFGVYMFLTIREAFAGNKSKPLANTSDGAMAGAAKSEATAEGGDEVNLLLAILKLIAGAAGIAIGADLLVDNGTIIAQELGVPESVIALTFVALGTSLPELVTAITALIKGHSALSLGNIIGANLFNIVLVSGIATTLSPFSIPQEKSIAGLNASLIIDIPIMLVVMGIMTIPAIIKGRLSRWQGIVMLCIYAGFCIFQFCF